MTPASSPGLALLAILGAYVLGSVPSGVLIARASGRDLLTEGSGNIGATNVWRTLGPVPGLMCFTLDGLKGAIPAASGFGLQGASWWPVLLGLFAILGHVWSIFLRFRGGKAVATGVGVLGALTPGVALGALGTWVLVLAVGRIVSLASVLAAMSLPLWSLLVPVSGPVQVLLWTVAIAIPVLHRGNLNRIRSGTEPRLGQQSELAGTRNQE
ncbi:MAG: glycerol-3-phosphate 1-O-acyltransferase PlsY [bacterium]|nr:glycerol-3-phosphate 1-O-acyltransferase PlsY [bacterium]